MTQSDRLTTRKEREVLRSIKRTCHAGLDSVALRERVARHTAAIVPTEASGLASTDPETGLFTHGWIDGIPDRLIEEYVETSYLDDVTDFLDLAASGKTTTIKINEGYREQLRSYGLERVAHAALCSHDVMWGAWCAYREGTSRPFQERELRFMRAVAPLLGYGLRYAAMKEKALEGGATGDDTAPGVLVLGSGGRATLQNRPATKQLEDLATVGMGRGSRSYALASVLIRLRAAHAEADNTLRTALRAQGRSGTSYILHGTLAEPDSAGNAAAVIVIEPARPRDTATSLSQAYGLSPREREVLVLVIRGETTKRIATRLGLSAYTVQDYLDRACEKVGVRGRRRLLARILADRSVPRESTRTGDRREVR
jgi:DNA-binding CsgD family transcriptional regulator